jgi:hypothetical protein
MRAIKALGACVVVAALAGPAFAQQQGIASGATQKEIDAAHAADLKKRNAELEKTAKSALGNIPEKKYDAWGNVRATEPAPAAARGNARTPAAR